MKITSIRSLVVHAEMRNWVFVRVDTDQSGLFGWGEATLEWKTRSVVGAIDDLAPLVLGRDPRDIEKLVRIMKKHSFWRLGVIGMSAVSGVNSRFGTSSANLLASRRGGCSAGRRATACGSIPISASATCGRSMRPRPPSS